MNKAQELLNILPKNEDKGSKKISAMFAWANSKEVMDAGAEDDAMSTVTDMYVYEVDQGLTGDEAMEIFNLGKKPQAEVYFDGDSLWICEDTQAMSSRLQKVATKYKLDIPRF